MANRKITLIISGILFLAAVAGFSQNETRESFIRGTNLFSGTHLEYWYFGNTHSFETVFPIYYSMDLKNYVDGLAVDLVTSPTYGLAAGTGVPEGNHVFGLTGTKMRTSYNFNNLVLGTFGIQVPTGANNLSASQTDVVGAMSTRQYRFKVNRMGSGWDLDFTLSSSMEVTDDLALGFGAGILTHGPYVPFDIQGTSKTQEKYNPGNEIALVVGADYTTFAMDKKLNIIGDLVYTFYTDDKWYYDDSLDNTFDAGDRIDVNVSAGAKLSAKYYNTLNVAFTYRMKSEAKTYGWDPFTGLPASNSTEEKEGGDLQLTNYLHFMKNKKYRPYALVQVSRFFSDEGDVGSAWVGGLGGGGILAFSNRFSLRGNTAVNAGRMNGLWLLGIEIGGGMNYDF